MQLPKHDRREKWMPSQWLRCMVALYFCGWAVCYANPFAFSPAFIRSVQRAAPASTATDYSLSNGIQLSILFRDGNSSAIAPTSSINGYVFTNNGTALVTNQGGVNNDGNLLCIRANNEFVSYGTPAEFARTGDMAVAIWVKQIGPTNNTQGYISRITNNNANFFRDYTIRLLNGNISISSGIGSAIFTTNYAAPVITNVWTHYALVYSNNIGYAFFTNGVLALTWTNLNTPYNSNGPLLIGSDTLTTSRADAQFGPTHLWRATKTASQVYNLYTNELAGNSYPNWKPQ